MSLTQGKVLWGGAPNYVDSGTLAAGSAAATLPVANLQTRQIKAEVWRTTVTTPASTYFVCDFGAVRQVDFASLIRHNLSPGALIRWRLNSSDSWGGAVLYDSGWLEAWPRISGFGSLPWGVFTWGGYLGEEDVEGLTISSFHVLPASHSATYLRCDIDDSANPDGYIQAGRCVAGPAYVPGTNMSFGWGIRYEDPSRVSKSRGGQTWIDEQERYRVVTLEHAHMSLEEAMGNVLHHIQRKKGVTGDLVLMLMPDTTEQLHNLALYGRLRALGDIRASYHRTYQTSFEFEELI